MQGMRFAVTVHLHGTLAANARGEFKLPVGATLEAVSISNSAATDALLDVGTSADRDGILDGVDCGDSGTPTLFTSANHNGALATANQPYRFAKSDIVAWDLDFDGASGTAAANCQIVFYFLEG
jgi:hypothetical protein